MGGMMGRTGWMTGSLVAVTLLLGSAAPAQARPRYDRGWGHHHHRDRDGFGDAVGVAALIGAVAIVASSLSRDRKTPPTGADMRDDGPPPADGTDYGADVRGGTAPSLAPARDDDFSDVAGPDDLAMTDACALAARDEAQGRGQGQRGYAEVRHMAVPQPVPGGYNIDGEVEIRASWRATGGTTRRFTCAMQDGRVAAVYLSRDRASAQ